jgi:tyrosinase
MSKKSYESWHVSRREFLATAAASIGSAAIPYGGATAQGAAKWRRINLSDPNTPQAQKDKVLGSYKKAIRAMLALPPDNPLNWYRNALIHTVDCPHGNWWFLVWHRGYIGWFEKKCRELSGDPEFALPYWDWTMQPSIPLEMFDDVLDPNNDAFISAGGIGKHDDFKSKFKDAVRKLDYWDTNSARYAQLLARGIRFPDDLWFDIIESPAGPFFFDRPLARGLTKDHPDLAAAEPSPPMQPLCVPAVANATILNALGPTDFVTFASSKAVGGHNVQVVGFGVLENQPHNLVHNCVGGAYNGKGGFMQAFLSPVDPLFFLHHSNMDRLWDVWTRKQQAHKNPNRYPVLPDGYLNPPKDTDCDDPNFRPQSDYDLWACEPFLFFVDEKGGPVTKTKAGDYAKIGDFNYDYQSGSGEEVVLPAAAVAAAPAVAEIQRFSAQITAPSLSATQAAVGAVDIPLDVLQETAQPEGRKLFAKVTVAFPPLGHAPLTVLVNAPPDARNIGPSSPYFAGTVAMFGTQVMRGPVTFTVPLSTTLKTLRANKLLAMNQPQVHIGVVLAALPHAAMARVAPAKVELASIVVEAH